MKDTNVQICANNPEHKFIKTHEGQINCFYCEKGLTYPPPAVVSYREDYWVEDITD